MKQCRHGSRRQTAAQEKGATACVVLQLLPVVGLTAAAIGGCGRIEDKGIGLGRSNRIKSQSRRNGQGTHDQQAVAVEFAATGVRNLAMQLYG